MQDHEYIQTRKRDGRLRDECLKCGKTKEAHLPWTERPLAILFRGRLWYFNNLEEARKKGFYLI